MARNNKQRSSKFGKVLVSHIKLLELYTGGARNMKDTNQNMV